MEKKQLIIGSLLTIASVVVSCVFVVHGSAVFLGEEAPKWLTTFGIVTAVYGLCRLIILILAWLRYGTWARMLISYFAVALMAVFSLSSLDVGMITGLEMAGLLVVGVMLYINWLAVSVVVKLRNVI